MEVKESLYPQLNPSAPEVATLMGGGGHTYRLQKIDDIQKTIKQEREKRDKLSKKYHRFMKIITGVDTALGVIAAGLGVAGIGVLSTIVAAPIALPMEGAALGLGLLAVIGAQTHAKLALKAEKHEKIKTLADAKLNTISDHISKALMDNTISEDEYALILGELEKFNIMKEEISLKIKTAIDEKTKQSFIDKGREEAMESFKKMFASQQKT